MNLSEGTAADWTASVEAMLCGNRVTVNGYRYTRPAPMTYEQQWLWDSCFHAIIYRWLDPDMARDELLSLIVHQVQDGPDAGMIPHMAYWDRQGAALWGQPDRSVITQPPLIGVAARLIYEVSPDRDLLLTLYAPLCAYHAWFSRRRDPDADGLVCLIHPWESGWDAAPRWDIPLRAGDNPAHDDLRQLRLALAETIQTYACDALRLAEDGWFCVEAADFNAIRAADLEALAWMAGLLERPAEAACWQAEARRVQRAIRRKLVRGGRIVDLSGPDEYPLTLPHAGEFVTLFGGGVSRHMAGRLVRRLAKPEFQAAYAIPTSPTDAAQFDPARYWRGNVWLSVNWLIWRGLRRYGYHRTASQLAASSMALVQASGFYEYFDPLTGHGLGASPYGWAGLVLDMAQVAGSG